MRVSSHKKGQVILFVIIILTISLIIISSVVSRSLTGQRNTSINTDSSRAFNAAESGIDELLSRSDLATIATGGQSQEISSVDKSLFSDSKYKAEEVSPGFFGLIPKNTLVQVEFSATPTNLTIYFDPTACVLLSFYDTNAVVTRRIICGSGAASSINGSEALGTGCSLSAFGSTNCSDIPFTTGQARMLLVKILVSNSNLQLAASDYASTFLTKNIVGTSWAETKSGVRKEIQVNTKTTKDIYPVFDYALYIR